MNEKHNIDRLFQEKFKDFEVAPPEFVWENIREELQEEKKTKGKVTPLWLRLSGVAALLLLGGLLATLFFNDAENPATNAPAVVVEDQNTTPANTVITSPDATAPAQAGPSATGTETGTAPQNNITTNNNTAVAVSEEATQNNEQNSATQTNSRNQRANSSANGFGKNNNNAVAYDRNAANRSTTNKNNRNAQMQNSNAVAGTQNSNSKNNKKGINTADNNGIATNSATSEGIAATNGKTAGSNTGSNAGVTNAANTAQRQNSNAASPTTEGIAATDAKSSGKNAGSTPNNGNTVQKQNGNANTTPTATEGIAGTDSKSSIKNTDSTNPAASSNLQKQNAANGIASTNSVAAANGATAKENASGTNTTNGTNDLAAKGNVIIDKNIPLGGEVAQTVVDTNKVVPQNELEKLLEEKLKGEEKDKELAENKKGKDRWNIRPQVAPVFYNSLSAGSPINEQLAANSKSYDNDLSYGLGINYAVTDRISIRSGINSVNLNYSTNDIAYYASLTGGTSNIGTAKATGFVIQPSNAAAPDVFLIDGQSTQLVEGSMIQKTGYIEIPLEMSYALVNNKFGVDLIGGVSSLFLNENNVSVVSSTGMSTEVGKAQNLNNLHFSTNLGVGFKYKFWDSFQASFEPTFKYQVNAYSRNAGNFKPYFVGLYSGVSFSF